MSDVRKAVVASIREFVELDDDFDEHTSLSGILDSVTVVQLVAVLEQQLGVNFEQVDLLDAAEWSSVARIANLVTRVRNRQK